MAKVSKNRKPTHFNTVDNLEQSIQGIISVSDAKKQILAQMLKDTVKNFKKDTDKNIDNKNVKIVNELNVSYQKIYDDIFSDINLSEDVGDIFAENKVDINNYIDADKLLDKKQIYNQIYKKWQESRKNVEKNSVSDDNENVEEQNTEETSATEEKENISENTNDQIKDNVQLNDEKAQKNISTEIEKQYFKPDKDVIKQYVSAIASILKKKYEKQINSSKNDKSNIKISKITKTEALPTKVKNVDNKKIKLTKIAQQSSNLISKSLKKILKIKNNNKNVSDKNLIKINSSDKNIIDIFKKCFKIFTKQSDERQNFLKTTISETDNFTKNNILKRWCSFNHNIFENIKQKLERLSDLSRDLWRSFNHNIFEIIKQKFERLRDLWCSFKHNIFENIKQKFERSRDLWRSFKHNIFENIKQYSKKICKATSIGAIKLFFPLIGSLFSKKIMKFLGPIGFVVKKLIGGIFKIVGFAFKIAGKLIGAVISGIKSVYSVFKKSVSVVYNGIMKILNTSFVKKLVKFILSPTGMFIFGYICGFIYAHVIKPIIKTKNGIKSRYKKFIDKLKEWKLTEKIFKIKDIVSSIIKKTWKFINKAKNFVVRKVKSNQMKRFIEHIRDIGGFGVLWSKIKLFFLELKESAIAIKNILIENIAGTIGATVGVVITLCFPGVGWAFGPIVTLLGGIIGTLIGDFFNSVPDIDNDAAKFNKTRSVRMANDKRYNRAVQRKNILKDNMQSSDYTEEQKKTMKEESAVLTNFGVQSDEESDFIEKLHEKINEEIKICDEHKDDNSVEIDGNLDDAVKPKIPSTIDADKLEVGDGKELIVDDGVNPYRYRLDSAVKKYHLLIGVREGYIDFKTFIEKYNNVDKKLNLNSDLYKIGNINKIFDEEMLKTNFTENKWYEFGDSDEKKRHYNRMKSIQAAKNLIMEKYDLFKNFGPNLTDLQKIELDVAITDWLKTSNHYNTFNIESAENKQYQEMFKKDAELLAAQLPIYAKDIYQESLENKNGESNKQTLEGISQSSTPSTDMEKIRQEEIIDSNQQFNEAEQDLKDEQDEVQKEIEEKDREMEFLKDLSKELEEECSDLQVKEKRTEKTIIIDGRENNQKLASKDS